MFRSHFYSPESLNRKGILAGKSHKRFRKKSISECKHSQKRLTTEHTQNTVPEKTWGLWTTKINLFKQEKSPSQGLIFCVTIIVGLNRTFFQFGGCGRSLKHILIEKASWEFWLYSNIFHLEWKGKLFLFHFMQNYSNWCLTFLIWTVKRYTAGSFHRINFFNYGYLTGRLGHKQEKDI